MAQTRSRNLPENIPPSGKIWQGPVFKALDKPKLAVKKDVRQVSKKKDQSEPVNAESGDSLSFFVAARNLPYPTMKVKMAVVGMAS